jgi:hypothetical protein
MYQFDEYIALLYLAGIDIFCSMYDLSYTIPLNTPLRMLQSLLINKRQKLNLIALFLWEAG